MQTETLSRLTSAMLENKAAGRKFTKQQTVASSFTEAEYMMLGYAVKELLRLTQLRKHIGLKMNNAACNFRGNKGYRML